MQKTKLGGRFWLALTVFSLVGQVAWVVENMYFNVFIYKMFHATAAQISLMVAASAVVATLTTILIGALSDRVGKRKIFICVGYLLWGISILSFALIRVDVISPMVSAGVAVTTVCVNLTILMDCVMTFFGSTANDACFNAWLTDSTDDTNRGAAEGINAMMPMMAILVVFGGFMFFDLEKAASWVTISPSSVWWSSSSALSASGSSGSPKSPLRRPAAIGAASCMASAPRSSAGIRCCISPCWPSQASASPSRFSCPISSSTTKNPSA